MPCPPHDPNLIFSSKKKEDEDDKCERTEGRRHDTRTWLVYTIQLNPTFGLLWDTVTPPLWMKSSVCRTELETQKEQIQPPWGSDVPLQSNGPPVTFLSSNQPLFLLECANSRGHAASPLVDFMEIDKIEVDDSILQMLTTSFYDYLWNICCAHIKDKVPHPLINGKLTVPRYNMILKFFCMFTPQ